VPTIIPSVIGQELCLRHRVALWLSALLAVRSNAQSRSLPSLALAWLSNTTRAITVSIFGERSTGSAGLLLLLGVDVVQAVHATLVVLAADIEVEAESGDGRDTV
jgi:hypothetical protein